MQNLIGKIALITGASSGIGEATATVLAQNGANLILVARRSERINGLSQKLTAEYGIEVLPIILDVRDKHKVNDAINNLDAKWQNIDILVNNAGLALSSDLIQDANPDNWDIMIDTNLKGLLYIIRAVLPNMIVRNSGHIVNISSTAGIEHYPGGNVYSGTKHAVRAISKSIRLDLNGYKIRVSDISPGATNTEFSTVRWNGDKDKADNFYSTFEPLLAEDIADTILFCVTRKLHVNVESIVVFPTDKPCSNPIFK